MTHSKNRFLIALCSLTFAALSGCGGGSGDSNSGDQQNSGNTNNEPLTYFSELSSWQEFTPSARPEEQEGTEVVDTSQAPIIETLVDANNITKECTTEHIDFFNTPEEYVMFSPPTNILYPGALVQGRSLRDGNSAGEILPLNISQRSAVNVSIPDCAIENNFRTVQPTQSNVSSAVSAILAEAEAEGADCVSPAGTLNVETFRNEQQRALRAGFSGRYFGFSGSASGSYSKTGTQNSVAAVFRESLYTVQIEAPQTPDDWFSSDFTQQQLQEQIDLDRIGPDNLPAYVAKVTYGRMLTATMTSSHSESDMRAAMEFKYSNPAASVSGDAAARSQSIRESSSMTLAYNGGSADATASMLQSNDWTSYFGSPVTASDAVPISFEIRSVSDNVPAVTQELTSYDRVNCIEKVADDASFTFQAEQQFTPGFSGTGQQVAMGDFNGDGAQDIVWANTDTAGRGEYAVAFSRADGSFEPLNEQFIDEMASYTEQEITLHTSDIDNDGRDDIVFNLIKSSAPDGNIVFVAFYKDEAGPDFIHSAKQVIDNSLTTGRGWQTYEMQTGQMDGKLGRDLVWNNRENATSIYRIWIAHAVDTQVDGFDLSSDNLFSLSNYSDLSGNFTGYEYTHIADLDGDGYDDVTLQNIGKGNMIMYTAYGDDSNIGSYTYKNYGSTWDVYSAFIGDNNGDGRADIIEPRQRSPFEDFVVYFEQGSNIRSSVIDPHIAVAYNSDNELTIKPLLGEPDANGLGLNPDMAIADINGDGGSDLIINEKGRVDPLTNNIAVGLSIVGDSNFTFTRAAQEHPQRIDWSQYRLFTGDITGDKRDDVLWISNAATNSVYVGIARGN